MATKYNNCLTPLAILAEVLPGHTRALAPRERRQAVRPERVVRDGALDQEHGPARGADHLVDAAVVGASTLVPQVERLRHADEGRRRPRVRSACVEINQCVGCTR